MVLLTVWFYPCGYSTVYCLCYAGTLLFNCRPCIVFVGIYVYNLDLLAIIEKMSITHAMTKEH